MSESKISMTGPYDVTVIFDGEKEQFNNVERVDVSGGIFYFTDNNNHEHCYFGNVQIYFTKKF